MTPQEDYNKKMWWVLREIERRRLFTEEGEKIKFPLIWHDDSPSHDIQLILLKRLAKPTEIDYCIDLSPGSDYLVKIIPDKFGKVYNLYEERNENSEENKAIREYIQAINPTIQDKKQEKDLAYSEKGAVSKFFKVEVRDREIWVNSYLLSKPHAVGKNMSFFEYLMDNPNTKIKRKDLGNFLKEEVSGKRFSKILNDIGFKGEILKAFFPKRGGGTVEFTPKIQKEDLERNGIKVNIFLKELELANARNSPK